MFNPCRVQMQAAIGTGEQECVIIKFVVFGTQSNPVRDVVRTVVLIVRNDVRCLNKPKLL